MSVIDRVLSSEVRFSVVFVGRIENVLLRLMEICGLFQVFPAIPFDAAIPVVLPWLSVFVFSARQITNMLPISGLHISTLDS